MQQGLYPQFLSQKPCGEDIYEGKSQERLVTAIAQHIQETDQEDIHADSLVTRVIGLEGSWGSGKSNVIRQLGKKLDDAYYIFEYDAWGYQEDLQRRTLLEVLTSELIGKNILFGTTHVSVIGEDKREVEWPDKLKFLLAKQSETQTARYPKINKLMGAVILAAILSPAMSSIGSWMHESLWGCLWAVLPLGCLLLYALWLIVTDKKYRDWGYVLSVFDGKIQNDVCYETISSQEPSVVEFRNWMASISEHIGTHHTKKLIVVFDNMDRLSSEKVKELWSLIHTFFSDGGFKNIWALIPYDQTHLANAYFECKNTADNSIQHFIHKTFPIVFRVAAPVLSDAQKAFMVLFEQAFGNVDDIQAMSRLYRRACPNANMRDIIAYINSLVALKKIWADAIKLYSLGIFSLFQQTILKDPVEMILSGSYLQSLHILNTEELQRDIAAIVYNVDCELALQIPLKKYLEGCFAEEKDYDLGKYKDHVAFECVLNEVIHLLEPDQLNQALHVVYQSDLGDLDVGYIWTHAACLIMNNIGAAEGFMRHHEILLEKLHSDELQNFIIWLNQQYSNLYGAEYYEAMHSLKLCMDKRLDLQADFAWVPISEEPQNFLDYVLAAQEHYNLFPVSCDPSQLEEYYCQMLTKNIMPYQALEYLRNDKKYSFGHLKKSIEARIRKGDVSIDTIENVYGAYKILCSHNLLGAKLPDDTILFLCDHVINLYQENGQIVSIGYDIIAMSWIAGCMSTPVQIENSSKVVKEMAFVMHYYASHSDWLNLCVMTRNALLNSILNLMIKNKSGKTANIMKFFEIFDQIVIQTKVTPEELLSDINRWRQFYDEKINSSNIADVIQSRDVFSISSQKSIEIYDKINKSIIAALSLLSVEQVVKFMCEKDSYWYNICKLYVNTNGFKPLPKNVVDGLKLHLTSIAADKVDYEAGDLWSVIHSKAKKQDLMPTVIDILQNYSNGVFPIISPQKFLMFAPFFESPQAFRRKDIRFAHRIIMPVLRDNTCLNYITDSQRIDKYVRRIKNDGDDAADCINKLKELFQEQPENEPLKQLVQRLGVLEEITEDTTKE